MRKKLIELENELNELRKEYINTHSALLYFTEHSMCRFIERVLNHSLYTHRMDDNEATTLMSWCKLSQIHPSELREQMLTLDEQKEIISNGLNEYIKDGHRYYIKSLTVTTVI
jgi:hypothetical protein